MDNREPPQETGLEVGNPRTPPQSSGGLKALIPQALVSAVVCGLLLFTGFLPSAYVKQSDNTANLNALGTDIENVKKSLFSIQSAANTASQDVAKMPSTFQAMVNGYAKLADVNTLQKQIDGIKSTDLSGVNSSISALQTKVETLNQQVVSDKAIIASLQSQIAILNGTQTNGGTTTTGKVVAALVINNNIPVSITTTNSTASVSYSVPFKVKITNGLNKEIQNLQLYTQILGYATSGTYPIGTVSLTSSSGGIWNAYSTSGTSYYFTNANTATWAGTGLTIAANTTKTITLIFTFAVSPNQQPAIIQFAPDLAPISTGDYDIS